MRQLDVSTQCLVASPSLLTSALSSPAELRGLPSASLPTQKREHVWSLATANGETAEISHRPRLVTDDMTALLNAALIGVGVAQLPTMMVWRDIDAGRLIHVLPDWRPKPGIVHAVFPSRRGLLPSVRALVDFLARECAAQRGQAKKTVGRHET